MQQKFFVIYALNPNEGSEKLNAFLAQHAGSRVERQFVADGANSYWSIVVSYIPNKTPEAKSRAKRTVDYRDHLSPEHFAIYARLRTLRNKLAEEQGSPAYAIFTNEQLAAMAQLSEYSLDSLAAIEGIGEKRLNLYGDVFLAELRQSHGEHP